MKRFVKTKKTLFYILCVLLLSCFCMTLGTSCADPQPDDYEEFVTIDCTQMHDSGTPTYDEDISISVSFDYLGKKIKISEKNFIGVTYTAYDNAGPSDLNVLIIFKNWMHELSESYLSQGYYGNGPSLEPDDNVCYVMGSHDELKEFPYRCFTQEPLCFYFENGSKEYNNFYNYGCEMNFYVDLRSLAVIESVEVGTLNLAVFIPPDSTIGFADRYTTNIVFYATDGEYVAFSDVSDEDAIAILTGDPADEPAEPTTPPESDSPSFWQKIADFFDGCD